MLNGTLTVRRPRVRVRDLEERFVSKVLPLFKRRSQAGNQLLPELYLHGLSTGNFELALRGLLGVGPPHGRAGHRGQASRGLEQAAQREAGRDRLALHHRRCPHPAQAPLSENVRLTDH